MNTTYSNTQIHSFIKEYIESENGEVKDTCEEYFTIKTPALLEPLRYTYKPAIAHEKKIDLIATGSPAFNGIIEECLKKGAVSSVDLNSKIEIQEFIKQFFKDYDYQCDFCEKLTIHRKTRYICTKVPKCYHKINNGKITKINIVGDKKVKLMLFIFSIFINNKLKKNEELVYILLDETGNRINEDILNNDSLLFTDSKEKIGLESFDKCNSVANELLDQIIKDKKNIFDLQLKKEIDCKLLSLEKKLDDEKLQKSISKKWQFDEKEWKFKKEAILTKERESLDTFVSVKFLNFLLVNTSRITFETKLNNNSNIKSSFLLGIENNIKVICPSCSKEISEGYATEDSNYVCLDCLNQSIETKKLYSKNFKLSKDNTTKEHIEQDVGFICSVCKKQNSKHFEFKCNHDNSIICYSCFEMCSKCNKLFSKDNLNKSKNTSKLYCPVHIKKCDNCNNLVGIDELRVCNASGLKVCSCTKFSKCLLCEQEYSMKNLKEGKCPACSNLNEDIEQRLISQILLHNTKMAKTKKWLIGKNKLNSVLVAKSLLSDSLFVLQDGKLIYEKKLGLFNKLKGY